MKYQYYDLGQRSRGQIVEVHLSGNPANVRLMDSSNFSSYKSGRQHRFYGGHYTTSPIQIPIPSSGRWYITIDFGGYAGRVRSSVNVLPGRLSEVRQAPLASVPSLVRDLDLPPGNPVDDEETKIYDVFISHASEDKNEVVRPLAHALRDEGLAVWYDEFELRIGDSLRRKIDKGLANSRFGVVVLSQDFFAKGWPQYELDGLVTKSISGEQVLLPVWHNITKQQVMKESPSLADKLARSTAMFTVEEIAVEIASVIQGAAVR